MAGVAWVKITTDMFDNRKIKHLRRLPDGNNIVLIWVMLLTMAGRCNAGGMIFLTKNIPYTPKMLADELDFEENTVIRALQALEQFNMIVTDGACFRIAGWEEYQNVEGLEKIREQNRLRQQRKRGKTKQTLIGDGNTCAYCGEAGSTVDHIVPLAKGGANVPENTVCSCLSCNMRKTNRPVHEFLNEMLATSIKFKKELIFANEKIMQYVAYDETASRFVSRDVTLHVTQGNAIDIEEDSDSERESEPITVSKDTVRSTDVQRVVEAWNALGLNTVKDIKPNTKRYAQFRKRVKDYGIDTIMEAIRQIPKSSFLCGGGKKGFVITFDWFIAPNNFVKVLEGNYADRQGNLKNTRAGAERMDDLDGIF